MSMHFSEELVYSKSISAHGNYKYLRVVPLGSTQNPTLSLTSTIQTQFELPNNVINLSLSKLCFDLVIPSTAGLVTFNNMYANALSLIDRITLTSRTGVVLADIANTHIFGNLVSCVNTKLSDLLGRNAPGTGLPAGTTTTGTPAQNGTSQAAALVASQLSPIGDIERCNNTYNYQVGAAGVAADALVNTAYSSYNEPLSIFRGPAVAQCNALTYHINLSAFKDTLMELNKNIYFGDNLVLTINWNSFVKTGFTTTAVVTTNALTGFAPFVNMTPSISNLFLYTACETDPTIISQLVASVSNGEFSLIVPFVLCQKYNASASTSSAMQQRLNSSYGSTLLRTYFGIFSNNESDLTTYTHNDGLITSYNTYMDGLRLQDYTVSIADSTHWLTNERNFRDSCIMNIGQFKTNFVHIDNWCGASPCQNDDSSLNGLSLDTDRTWSIQTVTPSAAYRYYAFFTTQKKLVISKGSLTLI